MALFDERKHAVQRIVTVTLLVMAATVSIYAENAYLENLTDMTLYVRSGADADYRQVPVGGLLPVSADANVEGFAYSAGSFSLPTLAIDSSSLEIGTAFPVGDSDLSQIVSLRPEDVASGVSGPRLDNRFMEWIAVDPVLARGRARAPVGAFVDHGGGREPLGLSESLVWQRAGTDVEWLKTRRVGADLFFAAATYSQISRATSLTIFLYGDAEFPEATIDIEAGRSSSLILLWRPRIPEPIVVGNTLSTAYFLEGQLWLDVIADALSPGVLDDGGLTAEIASGASASGIWEEFVLARLPLASLMDE